MMGMGYLLVVTQRVKMVDCEEVVNQVRGCWVVMPFEAKVVDCWVAVIQVRGC